MTIDAFRHCIEALEKHFGRQFGQGEQRRVLLNRAYQELKREEDPALMAATENLMLSSRSMPALMELMNAVKAEGLKRRQDAGNDLERASDQYRQQARRHDNILTSPPPGEMIRQAVQALGIFQAGGFTRREWLGVLTKFDREYPGQGWDVARDQLANHYADRGTDLDGYCQSRSFSAEAAA